MFSICKISNIRTRDEPSTAKDSFMSERRWKIFALCMLDAFTNTVKCDLLISFTNPTMRKFTAVFALTCALLLIDNGTIVDAGEITANPAEGIHLSHDELSTLGWNDENIIVDSNIPVTIQRYYDEDYFFMIGMQPVKEGDMKILVTSNCDSSVASIIPSVSVISTDNDVNSGFSSTSVAIKLDGVQSTQEFLAPSSYHAIWSYTSRCVSNPPDSGGVSIQSEGVEYENPSSSSVCRTSLLLSMLTLLQGVLSKSNRNYRNLESSNDCIFNAEILLDGCKFDLNVTAPRVRVINSTMENYTQEKGGLCTTNYETDLTFNSSPVFETNMTLNVFKMTDDRCARPIEGRPFVDYFGNKLFALISTTSTSWSAREALSSQNDSSTVNELSLGQEWTKSALGEHASIASFAAFSIALMTNGAPSNLVQDALNAALDEVRHARTSFAIASKLTGQDIGPGSLPESKHEFVQDLKALAIAVAKEGCIDETLSALDAAYKAELIGLALDTGLEGTEYASIDKDTLAWIQKELSIIAMDESRHSALAWRTINWICSVDSEACVEVKSNVFKEDNLEQAFHRRFGSVKTLNIMQLWGGHYLEDCIEEEDVGIDIHGLLSEAARQLIIQRHVATNVRSSSS